MSSSPSTMLSALGLGTGASNSKPHDLFAKISKLKRKPKTASPSPARHLHKPKPKQKPKADPEGYEEVEQILFEILDKLDRGLQPSKEPTSQGDFVAPDGRRFGDKRSLNKYVFRTFYTFQDKVEETLTKEPGSISGQPFEIKSLKKCEVRLMCYSSQVNVDQVAGSRVFIGPCETSVFIRDCTDCKFTVACKQLRLRDCSRCTFHLFSETDPIIETSSTLVFAPFNAAYKELEAQFKSARLNPKDNHWRQIFDFNPSEEEGDRLNYKLDESDVKTWNVSGNPEEAGCNPVSFDSKAVTVSDGGSRLPVRAPTPTKAGVFDWATPADLAVGTTVRVNFNRDSKKPLSSDFYAGKVVGINADGTYAIAYDDGDEEEKCNIAYIKASKEGNGQENLEPSEPRGVVDTKVEKDEDVRSLSVKSQVSDLVSNVSLESVSSEALSELPEESLLVEEVEEVETAVKRLLREKKTLAKKNATELRKLKLKLKKLKEEGEIERQRLSEDERKLSTLFRAFDPTGGKQRGVSHDISKVQRRITKQLEANQATRARRHKMVAQFKDMLHTLEVTTEPRLVQTKARRDTRILSIVKHLMNGMSMAYCTSRRGKMVEIPTLMAVTTVEWEQFVSNNPVHLIDFPSRAQDPEEWKQVGELLYTLGVCNPTLKEDFFKLWFDWSKSSGKEFVHVHVDTVTANRLGLASEESVIPALTFTNRSTAKFHEPSLCSTGGSRLQKARKPLTPLELAKNSIYRELCSTQWEDFEQTVNLEDSLLHRIQAGTLSTLRQYAAADTQAKAELFKARRQTRLDQANACYKKWKASKDDSAKHSQDESTNTQANPRRTASSSKAFECWEQRVEDEEHAAQVLNNIRSTAFCLGQLLDVPELRIVQNCAVGSHEAWLLVGKALKLLSPRLLPQWISWTCHSFEESVMLESLPFKLNFYKKANGQVYFVPERDVDGWSKNFSSGTVLLLFAQENQGPNIPVSRLCTPDIVSNGSVAVVEPGQFATEDQLFCCGKFQFELSNVAATTCTAYALPELVYSLYPILSDGSRSLTEAIRVHCTREWNRLPTAFTRWFPNTKSDIGETTLLREAVGIKRYAKATKIFAISQGNLRLLKLAKHNQALATDSIVFGCRPLLRQCTAELVPLPVKPFKPTRPGQSITPYIRIGDRIATSAEQSQTWRRVVSFDVIGRGVQTKPCNPPSSAKQHGLPSRRLPPKMCTNVRVSKLPISTIEGAIVHNEEHGFYQLPCSGLLRTWAKHLLQQLDRGA